MIIKNLDRNLYEAEFSNKDHFTKQVIYFILEGTSALLIDTAYEQEAEQLNTYLNERNIRIEKVIISHYHDDHFAGLMALKRITHEIEVIASSKYKRTLEKEYKDDFLLEPDIFPTTFSENHIFIFGGHQIRFEEAGGHSDCSIHTMIDEKYVHVADNIIFDTNDSSLLPLPYASIQVHLKTLEKLKEKPEALLLGSHFSSSLNTSKDMMLEIDARITYMQLVLKNKGELDYDRIKEMLPMEFNPRWHNLMLRFYKEQQEECNAAE
jgi:glyoxylase-like metal-dependent hydrolase (beta-lactamase superfamily II)